MATFQILLQNGSTEIIDGVDGYVGRVRDFIVDDDGWVIRHMVVDTGRWFPGMKVLVVPLWVESKPNNIVTTFKKSVEANSHFVFILMASKPISGT